MTISSSDIAVIVQGPVNEGLTARSLTSIRSVLPGAQIVFSTWKGSVVSELPCDVLIESDPPDVLIRSDGYRNNVNRQIASTLAGLRKADRPFALKIRSDSEMTGWRFVELFESAQSTPRNTSASLVRDRVVLCTRFVRNPVKCRYLYHFSDVLMFGRTDDLLDIWDIPLCTQDAAVRIDEEMRPAFGKKLRFTPEQYLFLNFLRKHGIDIDPSRVNEPNSRNFVQFESLLVNNFIFDEPRKLGFFLPKHLDLSDAGSSDYPLWSCYTYDDWLAMVRTYCQNHPVAIRRHLRLLAYWMSPLGRWFNAIIRAASQKDKS